ncbi:MAG: hypothetical protein KKA65_02275 [Nanoarchaeota archaeon]|nr:hypothetical protein [Nanoarchaeota archaeon]MBU4242019.1 hypothetical protein [Nanoarchaeota archaeon]MBU4351471.1 hypothetical protein [Nanoarchaeota archaeon]MBU4456303.1 hypothetical protein [Nanoarchaeota archaeon]MCG2719716.1 hypothetical protein [Nanoarchaeota archaeon]
MTIEQVINPKKKTDKDPKEIWANTEMDVTRRQECLCYNCNCMNDQPPYTSCPAAKALFDVCVNHAMAMMITRCGVQDEDGNLLYKPLKKQ